jgi:hypothetical protein
MLWTETRWGTPCRYIFLLGMLMSQFTITGYDA